MKTDLASLRRTQRHILVSRPGGASVDAPYYAVVDGGSLGAYISNLKGAMFVETLSLTTANYFTDGVAKSPQDVTAWDDGICLIRHLTTLAYAYCINVFGKSYISRDIWVGQIVYAPQTESVMVATGLNITARIPIMVT